MSIAGVQARVMELQSALGAVSRPPATTTTATSQFSSVLADQLGDHGTNQSAAVAGRQPAPTGQWGMLPGEWAAHQGGQLAGQGLLGALPASLATALTGGASGAAPADGTAAGRGRSHSWSSGRRGRGGSRVAWLSGSYGRDGFRARTDRIDATRRR